MEEQDQESPWVTTDFSFSPIPYVVPQQTLGLSSKYIQNLTLTICSANTLVPSYKHLSPGLLQQPWCKLQEPITFPGTLQGFLKVQPWFKIK